MKKAITTGILMATLIVAACVPSAKRQSTSSEVHYADMVGDNPDAEADIKVVSGYLNTLIVAGDVDKATSMLTSDFMDYGPGPEDSANLQKTIDTWKQNVTNQQNRKVDFVAETFNVKSGEQAGHWVSVWGSYSCTQNGKSLKFPFQYTAHVTNGKIDKDLVYYDQLYIVKALGYTVTAPSN